MVIMMTMTIVIELSLLELNHFISFFILIRIFLLVASNCLSSSQYLTQVILKPESCESLDPPLTS